MAPTHKGKGKKAVKTERLDVEEDEARQRRLQSLLEHLSTSDAPQASSPPFTSTSTSGFTSTAPKLVFPPHHTGIPNLSFDFGNRTTAPFVPNTELLSRIQTFLPALEASNRALLERARVDPRSVDIECLDNIHPGDAAEGGVDGGKEEGVEVSEEGKGKKRDGRVIEMNLGLGVFEEKRRTAGSKRDRSGSPSSPTSSDPSSGCPSSDSDSSDSSSSSSSGSDSDSSGSDSSDEDADAHDGGADDPLTTFFNSLRYGQTVSTDSSESECGSSCGGSDAEPDEGEEGKDKGPKGGKGTEGSREVKPLPKRARPVIEVLGEEDVGGVEGS